MRTEAGTGTETGTIVDRDWLHQFALVARQTTLASLTAVNTCILTTRVGLAVLDRYGIPARPLPVYVSVHNLEAWRLAEERVPVADWPSTAHSIGIDERSELTNRTGWNGHLVVLVRQPGQPRLVVDLTADQFDRPIRNLIVGGPVFMDVPTDPAAWTPRDPLFTTLGEGPDVVLSYRPMPPGHPEATRWQASRDWLESAEVVEAYVDQIVDRLPAPTPAAEAGR